MCKGNQQFLQGLYKAEKLLVFKLIFIQKMIYNKLMPMYDFEKCKILTKSKKESSYWLPMFHFNKDLVYPINKTYVDESLL